MGQIFSVLKKHHPWCEVLEKWINDENSPNHAIGVNTFFDPRVPPERLEKIEASAPGLVYKQNLSNSASGTSPQGEEEHAVQLKELITGYVNEQGDADHPDFLDHNTHVPLAEETELVWVLDLTGLYMIKGKHGPDSDDFIDRVEKELSCLDPAPTPLPKFSDRIPADAKPYWDIRLPQSDTRDRKQDVIRVVLKVLKEFQRHPIWVGLYEEMHPFLNAPPERWTEAVGVPRKIDRHLVVVKYCKGELKLFIPTTADAWAHNCHYLTPCLSASVLQGGRAMDLISDSTVTTAPVAATTPNVTATFANPPMQEFIHLHTLPDPTNLEVIALGVTTRDSGPDPAHPQQLVNTRHRQKERLKILFPSHAAMLDQIVD